LVISYVLDLPFGHGKMWLNGASGVEDKVVSGWGIDGVNHFPARFFRSRLPGLDPPLRWKVPVLASVTYVLTLWPDAAKGAAAA